METSSAVKQGLYVRWFYSIHLPRLRFDGGPNKGPSPQTHSGMGLFGNGSPPRGLKRGLRLIPVTSSLATLLPDTLLAAVVLVLFAGLVLLVDACVVDLFLLVAVFAGVGIFDFTGLEVLVPVFAGVLDTALPLDFFLFSSGSPSLYKVESIHLISLLSPFIC